MEANKFPVGSTYEFTGDINLLYQLDGIWTVENSYFIADSFVESTKDLDQPYLQVNHLGKEQGFAEQRTIAPNGSFNMKINSCEYHNAVNRGDYNISTTQGYLWFSKPIFVDFCNVLYNLRNSYPKTDPMNLVCKLILNSVYGRFAIKPVISKTEFVARDSEIWDFLEHNTVEDFEDINKNHILMTYRGNNIDEGVDIEYSNSIAIASAISAYARVFMSQFKNNPLFKLYYTDTDSAFIEGELPAEMIGKGLGQFKLESRFKEIVFLAPKVYSGITDDGKTITKVKGFKDRDKISFEDVKNLLHKDFSIKLNHVKWFRSVDKIEMKNQDYRLAATMTKREMIYENGVAIDTKAFKVQKNNKILNE